MTLGELALIGTGRGAGEPSTDTEVDDLVSRVDTGGGDGIERRLLLMAGAFDAYRRAGFIPSRLHTLPEAAAADARPACSAAAGEVLRDMIDGGYLALLPEACALLSRAGQRLPPPLLPDILDLTDARLRDAARPVLGERGRWLARQRDRWAWAAAPAAGAPGSIDDLRRTWEEGAFAARLAAITQLRASDPTTAREWIASTWSGEALEDRVRLLAIFETNLSIADEPWLSGTALRDRGGSVRTRAGLLLARLPDSTFAHRAIDRAAPLLAWEPTPDQGVWSRVKAIAGIDALGGTLRVDPPGAADPAWEQDGISIKAPKGMGERGYWLSQLLALVDPSHWSRSFNASPRALISAAWRTEWSLATITGWSRAALLHQNAEWIVALWESWLNVTDDRDPLAARMREEILAALFARMPTADAEDRVIAFMRHPQSHLRFDVPAALQRFAAPWSERLSNAVLDAIANLQRTLNDLKSHHTHVLPLLSATSYALPLAHLDRALALASAYQSSAFADITLARAADRLTIPMHLRRRLYHAVSTQEPSR